MPISRICFPWPSGPPNFVNVGGLGASRRGRAPHLGEIGGGARKGPPIQQKQGPEPKARAKGQSIEGGGGQNHIKIQVAHLRFATRSPSSSPLNSSSLPMLRVTLHRATCNIKKQELFTLLVKFLHPTTKKKNIKEHKRNNK